MGKAPTIQLEPQVEAPVKKQKTSKPKAKQEDISNIQTEQAKHEEQLMGEVLQGLGYLVHWNIRGCWTPAELQHSLVACDIDHQVTERGITSAVRSAIGKWKPNNGTRLRADLVDKNYDDGKSYFISIQEQNADLGNKKASWSQVDYLVLNKNTRQWDYAGEEANNNTQRFKNMVTHELNHMYGGDVRYHVIDPIVSALSPIPIGTGMRFIHSQHRETLVKLHKFVQDINGGDFHILMQASDKLTKQALHASTKEHLGDRLQKVQDKLKEYQGKGKIRGDASQNMLYELSEITKQAKLFEGALGVLQGEMQSTMDTIKQEIEQLVSASDPKAKEREELATTIQSLIDSAQEIAGAYVLKIEDATELKLPKKEGVITGSLGQAFQKLGYFAHKSDTHLVVQPIAIA